ncbi:MAG TPA: hypothetical protein VGU22_03200 [Methylomirabilota bacterium]|jgi:hypothetical protein|nr:hypothetical protein [Methylomirabilota bacterium]
MGRAIALLLGAAMLLAPVAVASAAPILSGKYAYSITSPCRAKIATQRNSSGQVTGINPLQNGEISEEIGTAIFSPSARVVSISGFTVQGSLLIVDSHGTNLTGPSPLAQSNIPYSNTATTFTFDGRVFQAVYANIDASNVARFLTFLGRDGNDCAVRGVIVK